jgi:hypothetical protein
MYSARIPPSPEIHSKVEIDVEEPHLSPCRCMKSEIRNMSEENWPVQPVHYFLCSVFNTNVPAPSFPSILYLYLIILMPFPLHTPNHPSPLFFHHSPNPVKYGVTPLLRYSGLNPSNEINTTVALKSCVPLFHSAVGSHSDNGVGSG